MARTYFSASSTGESTNATTTYTDKVALTLTAAQQAASTDYFIFWSALLGNATSLAEDMKVRLFDDTAAVALQEFNIEQADTTDYRSVGGCIKWTSAGTPADNTFSIEFAAETDDTIRIKEARIVVLKKETGDEYAESTGESTHTGDTNFTDKVTLAFTPGTSGDYLFVPSAGIKGSAIAAFEIQLLDNSSASQRLRRFIPKDVTEYVPAFSIYKGSSLSGSQTWKIQYRTVTSGNTASIRQAALLALRLDTFDVAQYAESNAVSATASASYQDKTTLTFTPAAVDHLTLAASHLGNDTTSLSAFARVDKGGAALQAEMLKEHGTVKNAAPLLDNHFLVHLEKLTAASTTWKTQWHQESGATNASIEQSAIAVLQLEAAGGGTEFPQSVNAAGAGAVTFAKQAGKGVAPAGVGTVTLSRAMVKLIASPSAGAAATIKNVGHAIALTGAGAAAALKSVGKPVAATGSGAVTISAFRQFLQAVNAASASAVSMVRSAGKIVAPLGAGAATLAKGVSKSIAATAAGAVAVDAIRVFLLTVDAVGAGAVTLARSVGKLVAGASDGAVTLTRSVAKTFGVAGSGAVTARKSVGKILAADAAGASMLERSAAKGLEITISGAVTPARAVAKTIGAAVTSAITITLSGFAIAYQVSLAITAASAVTMGKSVGKVINAAVAWVVRIWRRPSSITPRGGYTPGGPTGMQPAGTATHRPGGAEAYEPTGADGYRPGRKDTYEP